MFDFHLHSKVSFDSEAEPCHMLLAAERAGLKEICFTDHYDFNDDPKKNRDLFTVGEYVGAYGELHSQNVAVRRGVEFGLTTWNQNELKELLRGYDFDFVIGSVHYTGGYDPYFEEFWKFNGNGDVFEKYLLQTYECVKSHEDFDVLGHLTYVCKSEHNPIKRSIAYREYSDICDEIMKLLVSKGKGMEINTSGKLRLGEFLPSADYLRRFKELGGEIVTVGSDAHIPERVGGYINEALVLLKDIFGYVCTFNGRNAVYHKL